MSEIAPGGGQTQNGVANAEPRPSATPTASPQTEEGTPAAAVPPGAAGSVPSVVASDMKSMFDTADKAIATFAKTAGLSELKTDGTHVNRLLNTAKVFAKLTELGKSDPAMKAEAGKFLQATTKAGEKFGINFGLRMPAGAGQAKGEALNANVFKGVDTANNPYFALNKELVAEVTPKLGAKPGAGTQETTTTPTPVGANASSSAPMTDSAGATHRAGGNTPAEDGKPSAPNRMTADQVRAAVVPLMHQLAASDKSGDANVISRADIKAMDTTSMNPLVGQLMQKLDAALQQQVRQGGKDSVTISQATEFAVSEFTASASGAEAR